MFAPRLWGLQDAIGHGEHGSQVHRAQLEAVDDHLRQHLVGHYRATSHFIK